MKIVHVGRFNEQKNHGRLLRAFGMLLSQYPHCHLNLVGDGELMEGVKALAAELRIGEKITFLGSQSNVYPFLQEADVFVLPSDYEGMPMTIIEAMGTGLPIVATAVGGVPDMIENETSGLLVPCEEAAVAQAMARLVSDASLREKLGQKAKEGSARFSAAYMAEQYCKSYLAG